MIIHQFLQKNLPYTIFFKFNKVQEIKDFEPLLKKIIQTIPKDELLIHYKIADFNNVEELLENIF